MFSLFRSAAAEIDLTEDEVRPEIVTKSLLDRSKSSVARMLDRFRGDEMGLERDIAALTERLRQTRLAITAFEAAHAILHVDGSQAKASVEQRTEDVERLVPRRPRGLAAAKVADQDARQQA